VTRLESDSVGNKILDSFLIWGTRGSQHVGSSNASQEESYSQSRVQASNEVNSLQDRDTTHLADSSIIVQQEACTSGSGPAEKPQPQIVPHELCDLDEEVLAALPEDIRQEVLETYRPSSSSHVQRHEVVTKLKSPTTEQVPSTCWLIQGLFI
jgi:hypothetical protein